MTSQRPDEPLPEEEPRGPGEPHPEEEPPPLIEFLERSPGRLLLEAALGAVGGAVLAGALPGGAGREGLFAAVGGAAAVVSLMLTPVSGSVPYRALRYGIALSLTVTLIYSFAAGTDLLVEQLLAIGIVVFGIGAVGHGLMAATLDSESREAD